MIRHLLKLVWNRKKTQALIMLEIFLSFVVVFALLASAIYFTGQYRRPLGFNYENVWIVNVDRETGKYGWEPAEAQQFRRLRHELERMPSIVSVASANNAPFSGSQDVWSWGVDGRDATSETLRGSTTYGETLGVELVAGRWFNHDDAALEWESVVIDRRLSIQLYGDEDPIGRTLDNGSSETREKRVVGLVDAFRREGHFGTPMPMLIMPVDEHSDEGTPTRMLVIKVVENVAVDFEQEMVEKLQSAAHGWTFSVKRMEDSRRDNLSSRLIPLAIFGTVGAFLLVMVILGLTGVMWQNVTRRTREIGLRRAAGASRSAVHRQIVMEVMITAVFAAGIGAALAMQVPFVGPFSFLPVSIAVQAVVGTTLAILALAAMCGLYPGWSATRIAPAEALHYE